MFYLTHTHSLSLSLGSRTDLSNALNNPKLEDFLGASINNNNNNHFSTETTSSYDSELKSIAASFLRGYDTTTTTTSSTAVQHSEEIKKQLLPLPPPPPLTATAKKPAETFGQRTSIYRGVTRYIHARKVLIFIIIIISFGYK